MGGIQNYTTKNYSAIMGISLYEKDEYSPSKYELNINSNYSINDLNKPNHVGTKILKNKPDRDMKKYKQELVLSNKKIIFLSPSPSLLLINASI